MTKQPQDQTRQAQNKARQDKTKQNKTNRNKIRQDNKSVYVSLSTFLQRVYFAFYLAETEVSLLFSCLCLVFVSVLVFVFGLVLVLQLFFWISTKSCLRLVCLCILYRPVWALCVWLVFLYFSANWTHPNPNLHPNPNPNPDSEVWANLTEKDSVIFYDNDIEIFVDVDGSNHEYKGLFLTILMIVFFDFIVFFFFVSLVFLYIVVLNFVFFFTKNSKWMRLTRPGIYFWM